MIDIDTFIFDDKEYAIIESIKLNGNEYVVLSNLDDPKDHIVRRYINKDGKDILYKLSSEEELKTVLKTFKDKYN